MASIATAPPKKKGVFKALKAELQQVKQKWGQSIKLYWTTPGPPWPARVTRTIDKTTEAQAYDVEEIRVRLWFDSSTFDQLPIRVEVDPHKTLPKTLANLIAKDILHHWTEELQIELSMPEHLRSGWLVESTLDWCEEQYAKFLQLAPSMIESYLGFDDQGMTSRRFTLVDPDLLSLEEAMKLKNGGSAAGESKTTAASGATDSRTEEEKRSDEARRKRKALERQKATDRERELKRVDGERKKAEAQRLRDLGLDPSGFKPKSKAEKAEIEARKKSQGKRTAKTGSRATKFSGEGSTTKAEKKAKKKKKT